MILQFNDAQNKKEKTATIDNVTSLAPVLTIPHAAIAAKSGGGDHLDVMRIDIQGEDGRSVGKFWVDVFLNKQGRPVLHIATNVGDGTNTKRLVGSWRGGYKHEVALGGHRDDHTVEHEDGDD